MKKILFLFLFLPSILFGQNPLRLPYVSILHTYQGDTIKQYFSGDSAKWYTDKGYVSFGKPVYSVGKKLITTIDTTNKWLPKTGTSVNSNLFQSKDSTYYNLSLTRKIKASDTTRWAEGSSGGTSLKNYHATDTTVSVIGTGNTLMYLNNTGTGKALHLSNTGTGYNLYNYNQGNGFASVIMNTSGGYGSYISNTSTGWGQYIYNTGEGIPFTIHNASNAIFEVDKNGNVNIPSGSTYQVNGVPIGSGGSTQTAAQIRDSLASLSGTNRLDVGAVKNALSTTGNGSGLTGITASQVGAATNAAIHDSVINKQNNITLTTTGTSGAATLTGATLNIPQYSGGISGLTPNLLAYGKNDGTITQNTKLEYNDTTLKINNPSVFATSGKKIVFIGNSFTYGTGASSNYHRYSTVAIRLLSGYGYVEQNNGIGGTVLSVNYVPTKASDMEFLVIQYGTNEAGANWGLKKYADSLKSVIDKAILKGWSANKLILVSAPYVNEGSGSYSSTLLRGYVKSNDSLANIYGSTPVNIYNPFLNSIYSFLPKATTHPDDMGYELIGYAVAGAIQSTFNANAGLSVNKPAIFNNIILNKRNFITKGQLIGIDSLGYLGVIHNLEPNTQTNGILRINGSILQGGTTPAQLTATNWDTTKAIVLNGSYIYSLASSAYGKMSPMLATGDSYFSNGYSGGTIHIQTAPVSTNTFVDAITIAANGTTTFANGFAIPLNKLISSSNGVYTCDYNLIDGSYYTNLRNLAPTGAFQFYLSNGGTNTPVLMNKILYNGHSIFQNGGTFTDVPSSRLTINSTTEGFLPPRMTTTQRDAISTPAEGLVIYNLTNHALEFFNGTVWKTVTTN